MSADRDRARWYGGPASSHVELERQEAERQWRVEWFDVSGCARHSMPGGELAARRQLAALEHVDGVTGAVLLTRTVSPWEVAP